MDTRETFTRKNWSTARKHLNYSRHLCTRTRSSKLLGNRTSRSSSDSESTTFIGKTGHSKSISFRTVSHRVELPPNLLWRKYYSSEILIKQCSDRFRWKPRTEFNKIDRKLTLLKKRNFYCRFNFRFKGKVHILFSCRQWLQKLYYVVKLPFLVITVKQCRACIVILSR